MLKIEDKRDCCGCEACKNICPKKCISMKIDEEGFFYPQINQKNCINCDRCSKVCPVLNSNKRHPPVSSVVCYSKNAEIRKRSTSGGFFAELSEYIIEQGGVVFGVSYDNGFMTHHIMIDDKDDLHKICRSKYIQSSIEDSFINAKALLDQGRLVLFSGTSCQIAGLKNFLNKDYPGLITCDVVCRGVISPGLWKKHIAELEHNFNSEIKYIGFREKTGSFHKTKLVVVFKNGKQYSPSTNVEWISRFFTDGICLRPSCYQCKYKGLERPSDFTMFDCWEVSRLVPSVKDDDKGYTNVILHTNKAAEYFGKIKDRIISYDMDVSLAKKYDGIMIDNCVKMPDNRDSFFIDMQQLSISELGVKYSPIALKIKLRETIKNIVRMIGIYKN